MYPACLSLIIIICCHSCTVHANQVQSIMTISRSWFSTTDVHGVQHSTTGEKSRMMQLLICKAQLSKKTSGEPNARASFSDSSSNFECEHQPSANHKRTQLHYDGWFECTADRHACDERIFYNVVGTPVANRVAFHVLCHTVSYLLACCPNYTVVCHTVAVRNWLSACLDVCTVITVAHHQMAAAI